MTAGERVFSVVRGRLYERLPALAALVWKLDIRYVYPLMSIDVIVQIFLCFPRLRSGRWIHDVTRGAGELEA